MAGYYNPTSNVGDTRNILAIWSLLSDTERRNARLWYLQAHEDACTLAHTYDLSVDTASQVISAISPMRTWENNIAHAEELIRTWLEHPYQPKRTRIPLPTGWRNVCKAFAILNGETEIKQRGAPKTFNFWHNLADPYNPDYVTIDSHAIKVWLGDPTPGTVKITAKQYRLAKAAYIQAAELLGERPNAVQAGTWTKRRELLLDGQLGPLS